MLLATLGAPQARFEWQAQHSEHLRFVLRGRRSTWSTSGPFCMACSALEASQLRVAGPFLRLKPSTQHHLHYILKHTIINTTPSRQHHQHNLINTTSSTHHHLHKTIYTTPSTLHHQTQHHQHTPFTLHHQHNIINTTRHQHITIYITPSTQHHLHYIIKHWQVQHLEHCHISPSASFLLRPILLFFVCSLFCFVGLFHCWMSEDIVNMWGCPVL